MFRYFKRGWNGELKFSEVLFASGGDYFLLEGGIAYIGFYILFAILLMTSKPLSLDNILALALFSYGIVFYIWLLKAFWGSANFCSNKISAGLIRTFTIILPLISIVLFVLIIIYYLVTAIMDALSG
ncbi:hypothetical protein [Legionella pneumophila]|uniref:Yip1 domain-containing protein n=1 Tax=Legionella pneumophila subsp. pascullei TaxID=91890 RepID=A0AAX2IW01_LEGPN|nr:hypothetical protein [Legionella pneumophila]AMP90156.1 hypothetical protein AXF35_10850 [Legionella pneumophila subsp. pascullei]AMP92175.1 hypothetical protein AXF36_05950 [Legionella pneumophila subsp. pascullei]AMP95141.1 hypothetical protein AXF37_05840 [Legionella pneumophila subsp. pascullei]SQG90022.1 Uncharacterised protein [Legionella pneumophila subsp. pascullei]VEH05878.1 Uncharacterised protein [Legionella pneumophila subsp. pascullei]